MQPTQKTNLTAPATLDIRVRDRNLKAGLLTEKDVEKHLSALPDLSDQADSFATPQPALDQPDLDDEDDVDAEGEGDQP